MGKHSTQHTRIKKEPKKMNPKILIIIAVVAIIIAAIIKVNTSKKNNTPENALENEITNTVNNTFSSLKESKIDDVQKHLNYVELISGLDEMVYQNGESELEKNLFKNILWKTTSVKVEGDTATAIVEITNKNYKNIITKWMKEIVDENTKGTEITQEFILNKLNEIVEAETETKTLSKALILKKQDNEWKIRVNNELINLIYPGIDSVVEALNQNV